MTFAIKFTATGDLRKFAADTLKDAERGALIAAQKFAVRVKLALRDDVRKAGLGRLANAWQTKVYPEKGESLSSAVYAYVKGKRAPLQIRAFAEGATIRGRSGQYLAIPTENTPRKGRSLATPHDVEGMFNQDLIVLHGRGGQLLAFVDVVKAKSGKGFRKSKRARTKDGREKQLVLMFVLVRQVTLRRRVDWRRVARDMRAEWRTLVATEIAASINR